MQLVSWDAAYEPRFTKEIIPNVNVFLTGPAKKNLIFTVPIRPVVIEPMSDFLVDGRHGFHVTLSPLAAEILGLYLEKFEDVELHHGLFNLERSLEDRSRLEHHKHLERKETSTNQ